MLERGGLDKEELMFGDMEWVIVTPTEVKDDGRAELKMKMKMELDL